MPRPPLPELPLVKKELVGLLRTKRAFWFLIAAVAVSSLLSLVAWPSSASGVTESRLVVAAAGTFLLTQLTAALVIVPAFAAGAISGERERGTYEVLLTTPLSPASIVLSKALAAAGYVVILLVASAPGIIVLHLLGEVTFGSILRCQAVTLAAVVLSTFICLWASMRSKRTSRAVTFSMIGIVLWNGGICFLVLGGISTLRSLGSKSFAGIEPYVVALSPHLTIAVEVFGDDFLAVKTDLPGSLWALHVAGAAFLSLSYLLRSTAWRGDVESIHLQRSLRRPTRRPLLTRLILEMRKDGGPFGNPVFLKEIRTEFFGRVWYRRFVFWGLVVLFGLVILGTVGSNEVEQEITTIAGVGILLIALLAPGLSASAFPREIEQGHLDMLRGTMMSPWGVLRGKFFAALYGTFGVVAAAGWSIGIAAWSGEWPASRGLPGNHALVSTGVLATCVLLTMWVFVTAVGMCASVLTKRTLTALVGSYAALAAWLIVIPAISGVLTPGNIAMQPLLAVDAALSGGHDVPLLCFFLLHAAITLALWHAARLEVEVLRSRDA